jgi:O-methyltransferase
VKWSPDMATQAKDSYIQLLKATLSGAVYDEPPIPVELHWCRRGWVKQFLARTLSRVLGAMGATLCFRVKHSREDLESGRTWPVQACSMIGQRRMDNLTACVEKVLENNVPGDFIETGVWRGGACILMRGILSAHGVTDRKVYVADSFQGLPPPDAAKYPADAGDIHHTFSFLAVSRQQVEENFRRFGLLDSQVVFLEGWFKDTLPKLPAQPMAIIRLDGDMYESTMDALTHLHPKLSPGGFCIIDDYMIESCRRAVEDYRNFHHITDPIENIDGWAVFWQKGATAQ